MHHMITQEAESIKAVRQFLFDTWTLAAHYADLKKRALNARFFGGQCSGRGRPYLGCFAGYSPK